MYKDSSTVEDFLKEIDQARANEIERKFFEDILNESEKFPTLAAGIAFIICRIAAKVADDNVEGCDAMDILGAIAALVLETKVNKYSLN